MSEYLDWHMSGYLRLYGRQPDVMTVVQWIFEWQRLQTAGSGGNQWTSTSGDNITQ